MSFTPVILALIKNNENLAKFLEDQRKKIQEPDELDRSSKKTSNEKDKVKEEENHMFELNELISSSEGNSEDCEMFSHDTILQLIEQLRRQSKGLRIYAQWRRTQIHIKVESLHIMLQVQLTAKTMWYLT